MRLSVLVPDGPSYDGLLYREATLRWLSGQDPWAIPATGAIYAAPPPTLLAMLPFAAVPDDVARVLLLVAGISANMWMIRRLRMPPWWLLFPPLVDGIWIGNPHVLVAPLLVAGAAPVAAFVKLYGLAVPALLLQSRAIFVTGLLLLATAPFLPWQLFFERWGEVSAALRDQSAGGGFSVWVTPLLLPVALVAAVLIGRVRLAWWSVPVFWPFTQWYYSSLPLPVLTPLAAAALSVPAPGATTVGLALAVAEVWWRGRRLTRTRPQVAPDGARLGASQ